MSRFSRKPGRRAGSAIESLEQRLFLSSTVLTANVADNGIDNTGTSPWVGGTTIRIGDNGTNASERSAIFPFLLPSLPVGAVITGATANFNLESIGNAASVQGAMDVYGLGRRSAATVLAQDYYRGSYGGDATDATAIQATLATNTTPTGALSLNTTGQANLLGYLQNQYEGGTGAGQYVFIRLSHQVEQLTSRYWVVSTANNATTANRPTITITYEVNPAAPTNLTAATTGSSSVVLNWTDNASNETGFRIERSANGTSWSTAGTVGANVTTFTDTTGLSADTQYHYRVIASNGADSDPSNAVTATTLPVFTNTRWVDVNYTGATSNGGYATPYKTIASALTAATSGDGIVLRGGTYREAFTMKGGVTLMGTPGERAIISGMEALGGWTLHSGSTYKTTLNWKPNTLFVDYDQQDVSRSPNTGWWVAPTVVQGTGTTTITDAAHLAGIPSLVGGTIQVHTVSGNLWKSAQITAHNTTTGEITTNLSGMANNDYYMVKNKLDLLDNPGEWAVVDNGNGTFTVFFRPTNLADLNKTQARKTGTQQIRFTAASNGSTLRNVEVTGNTGNGMYIAGSTASPASNITVHHVISHNHGGTGIAVRYAANITVRNSISVANDVSGITVASTHTALIDQNEVAWNSNDAVVVAGDISGKVPGDVGFDNTTDVTVSNNYIHDQNGFNHADGIQMYRWPTGTKIYNNFVTRASQGLMAEQTDNSELVGNIFWNTGAYNVIFGHSNSNNWLVKGNTIGGAGYAPYNITGTGYNFQENVYYSRVAYPSITGNQITTNRNLYYAPGSTTALRTGTPSKNYSSIATFYGDTGQGANSAIGDPLFENTHYIATVMEDVLAATTTSMIVRSLTGFAVGDKIQLNGDGVVRTVTAIDTGTKRITFDVALPMVPLSPHVVVENFKTSTNFTTDLRLKSASPAQTMGATGGKIGSNISTVAFINGDFNNDGIRDIPLVDSGIIAGLPGANGWVPKTGF